MDISYFYLSFKGVILICLYLIQFIIIFHLFYIIILSTLSSIRQYPSCFLIFYFLTIFNSFRIQGTADFNLSSINFEKCSQKSVFCKFRKFSPSFPKKNIRRNCQFFFSCKIFDYFFLNFSKKWPTFKYAFITSIATLLACFSFKK